MSGGFQTVADLLTTKVPFAIGEQLREWVSGSTLDRMVRAGFLAKHRVLVRWPLVRITEPLDSWLAGDHPAWRGNPEKIAVRAQARWRDVPTRFKSVFVGTPKLMSLVGGVATGKIRQALQCGHDAHLLECMKLLTPEARASWRGEQYLRATEWDRWKKIPDALIDGPIAIEFVSGSYGAARVREFQDFCLAEKLSYLMF